VLQASTPNYPVSLEYCSLICHALTVVEQLS